MIMGCYPLAADMAETWRLWATIHTRRPAIEVLITHRVTNECASHCTFYGGWSGWLSTDSDFRVIHAAIE